MNTKTTEKLIAINRTYLRKLFKTVAIRITAGTCVFVTMGLFLSHGLNDEKEINQIVQNVVSFCSPSHLGATVLALLVLSGFGSAILNCIRKLGLDEDRVAKFIKEIIEEGQRVVIQFGSALIGVLFIILMHSLNTKNWDECLRAISYIGAIFVSFVALGTLTMLFFGNEDNGTKSDYTNRL